MLKKRLICVLPLLNDIVVQSIGFNRYLPVGRPQIAVEFLNKWGIDEIILVDISARRNGCAINYNLIKEISRFCYVPLTFSGGINGIEDVEKLMQSGADKVALNRAVLTNPTLLGQISKNYGEQCVVASIDVIKKGEDYYAYNYLDKAPSNITLTDALKIAIDNGAGELFINSVDRDGLYLGYDIELFRKISAQVNVPVLACGGAKNAYSILDLFQKTEVSAACAGNFFNFSEHSVILTKSLLQQKGVDVRLETYANYKSNQFDQFGRLLKKSDETLQHLLYLKIDKEII